MSYGKLNIWINDLNCNPKNVWKVELVVKTCTGAYLVDFNPDIISKLQKALPGYNITKGRRFDNQTNIWETTIRILAPWNQSIIKHLEVDVPPGCYMVRAWVCYGNLWTDRVKVTVDCGRDVCIHLVVPVANNCIGNVILPWGVVAHRFIAGLVKQQGDLTEEEVKITLNTLLTTGEVPKEILLEELNNLVAELDVSCAPPDVQEYVDAFKYMLTLIG